jgi:hypothetical protein
MFTQISAPHKCVRCVKAKSVVVCSKILESTDKNDARQDPIDTKGHVSTTMDAITIFTANSYTPDVQSCAMLVTDSLSSFDIPIYLHTSPLVNFLVKGMTMRLRSLNRQQQKRLAAPCFYCQFMPKTPLKIHFPHAIMPPPSYKYNDCAATMSRLTFVSAISNFCSSSSLPMTLDACAIWRISSSRRLNRRIRLPSYTSVILLWIWLACVSR